MDLVGLFSLDVDPLEIVLRGSAVYWFLFVLFRYLLRRDVGSIGIADILLLVLIADAAQNAMSGGYESISAGLLLIATIAGWNVAVNWLAFRFDALHRLLEPKPLLLVRDGRLLRANMKRELISHDELMAALRRQGIEQLSQVKAAYMESDGEISVMQRPAPSGESGASTAPQRVAGEP